MMGGYLVYINTAAIQLFNACVAWSLLQPLAHYRKLLGTAASEYLYRTIGKIAGIAAETEPVCLGLGAAAKPDSLYAPVDETFDAVLVAHAVPRYFAGLGLLAAVVSAASVGACLSAR